MGLDLCHLKAVDKPVDPDDYLELEFFSGEAFDEYGFAPYVRDIPTIRGVHTARFCDTSVAYESALSRHSTSGYGDRATYFLGSPDEGQSELRALEERLGLSPSQASPSATTTCTWLQDGVEHRSRDVSYYEPTTVKGIYFIKVGYQRKWMYNNFYEDYLSFHAYLEYGRFANLRGYLWEDAPPEVVQNLNDAFVQNYERGRSMLFFTA